jgi:hypothetical protein
MTVGIMKELMDANPGGSGFSFVDLTADRAGNLFAARAILSADSARQLQLQIRDGLTGNDYCPDIANLPEGIPRDQFQEEYGGLGGQRTNRIVAEIQRRLAACKALHPSP